MNGKEFFFSLFETFGMADEKSTNKKAWSNDATVTFIWDIGKSGNLL